MLGCGAHLSGLRRTLTGPLQLGSAHTLDALARLDESARMALLQPPDCLLQDLPACHIDAGAARRLVHGQTVDADGLPADVDTTEGRVMRAYVGPVFLGLVAARNGQLQVKRLLPQESGQKA